mgnify:CR=1 FL=1
MSSNSHREAVLSDLGVTELEYDAMICPSYGVPLGLRKMASWTVLENDACSCSDCVSYSADDYLAALEGMLRKGWLCLKPVHIYGTVAGQRFSFSDLPAWNAPTYLDEDAVFHWVFQVWGPPRKKVPEHAILTGEDTAVGGYGVADILDESHEAVEGERNWMLNLNEARDIVVKCATKWTQGSQPSSPE